jgi:arsenite methyltransferase
MSTSLSVSTPSRPTAVAQPAWLWDVLGAPAQREGGAFDVAGTAYRVIGSIPRQASLLSETQTQTQDAFSYVWSGEGRFESEASLTPLRDWFRENYGNVEEAAWWSTLGDNPLVIEAGCGGGISGSETFGSRVNRVRYLAVDVSDAVDRAAQRFARKGLKAAFVQADLMNLPVADGTADLAYSQGVLHHTDSTERAIAAVARKLRKGGRFLFYVYKRKGPIREYTDDYIRDLLQGRSHREQWELMLPLSKFGRALAEVDVEVDVPEAVDLLGIPAGRVNLQRLFYWHVAKAYDRPEMTLDEINHVNLDWYLPVNAQRQTPEEVHTWCESAGLSIEREHVQDAGISIIAVKR